MRALFFVLSLLALPIAFAMPIQPKVIYGDDNRVDVYAVQDQNLIALADATAAMVPSDKMSLDHQGNYQYEMETFGTSYETCPEEPFKDQPNPAVCSGFLVGEDILVTAGHCIRSMMDCSTNKWVFNFRMKNESEAPKTMAADDVYTCKEILKQELTNAKQDYSIVRLDRPVRGARPLKMRSQGELGLGDGVMVIGHPMGLPTKIADGARVRSWDKAKTFFVANLDTYGGNSGSAVLNSSTFEVEGILVRGETDMLNVGGCYRSKRCAGDSCRGEDVTNISYVQKVVSGGSGL